MDQASARRIEAVAGKGVGRPGGSIGSAADFSHELPGSPEHNLGLKAHAAEFVPGGGGGGGRAGSGGAQKKGNKGQQSSSSKGGGAAAAAAFAAAHAAAKAAANAAAKGMPGSDLTAFAREFVPAGGGGEESDAAGAAGAGGAQKMVQVVRGGTIYFVPESEALATDELVGPEAYDAAEDGFAWAHESTAVPAAHRRTMHRCYIA